MVITMTVQLGDDIKITELANGVFARLHEGRTNSGIIIGDNSVMVIDSLQAPSAARSLIEDVRYITNKSIKYVVNTHSHWDHAWGNEEFPDAHIIGHVNCYSELIDVEWNKNWRDEVARMNNPWSDEAHIINITPPNLTFDNQMQIYFGGRVISFYYFGRAHTSGDIFTYLPTEQIAFTGDVADHKGVPFLADCYPEEWVDTDDKLLTLPIDRFMAGHGPIGGYQSLVESRDFIDQLINNVKVAIKDGKDQTEVTSSVKKALESQFGDRRGFDGLSNGISDLCRRLNVV